MTDDEARTAWAEADRLTRAGEQLLNQGGRIREHVVTDLQSRGLGFRRIAQVLGVAHHQQLDQIARRARRREAPPVPES